MRTMNNCLIGQINFLNNYSKNYSYENNSSIKKKSLILNYQNKPSSIQFDFNFDFNNIKSSPFSHLNSQKYNSFNNTNNTYKNIPISYLFKLSLGKSGYIISNKQTINFNNDHKNGIYSEFQNINSYNGVARFYDKFTQNLAYPINNNSIRNNIYLSINKLPNIALLSKDNKIFLNVKENEINFRNKKEDINQNIFCINNIFEEKNIEKEKNKENSLNQKETVLFECIESRRSKNFLK